MAMDIYDAVGGDGLFNILGKAFYALDVLNTARQTTVPPEVQDILSQFKLFADNTKPVWAQVMEGLPAGLSGWQETQVLANQIRQNCENLVIQWAADDSAQPDRTVRTALAYLIGRMKALGYYVTANTVGLTLSPVGTPLGDTLVVATHLRGDGRVAEHSLGETLKLVISGDELQVRGSEAEFDRLAGRWPKGSGTNIGVGIHDPPGLVPTGDFDTETSALGGIPQGWIAATATPGSTVKLTPVPVQTVTISGSPTGGGYYLQWTDSSGKTWATELLAYNATASQVQAALRSIPGLEKIEVSSTGTSPNYTHTLRFVGVGGQPAQLTSINRLTGGTNPTIAHATTEAGSVGAYRGRALELASNGTELTTLYVPVTLQADTVYALAVRARAAGTILAGQLRLDLVDGIGGSTINDSSGNANSLVIAATGIPTASHQAYTATFRVPPTIKMPCYLRLAITTAITAGTSVFLDDLTLVRATELYPGGPHAAAISGKRTADGDSWSLQVTNNRAGKIQEWFQRMFGMTELASPPLLLPVTGTTLIPENIIS